MSRFAKIVISGGVFVGVGIFSWAILALLLPASLAWIVSIFSFAAAIAAALYVWRRLETAGQGLFMTVVRWAAIAGGVGFCGGFFGPMIFVPESNQGPMLGILITGPAGFLAGGIAGLIYGLWRKSHPAAL